jgi:hypothetical protein
MLPFARAELAAVMSEAAPLTSPSVYRLMDQRGPRAGVVSHLSYRCRVGAAQRVRGARAVAAETQAQRDTARHARLVTVGGRPGIAVTSGSEVRSVPVFDVVGERIARYDVIADPRRLALLRVED